MLIFIYKVNVILYSSIPCEIYYISNYLMYLYLCMSINIFKIYFELWITIIILLLYRLYCQLHLRGISLYLLSTTSEGFEYCSYCLESLT